MKKFNCIIVVSIIVFILTGCSKEDIQSVPIQADEDTSIADYKAGKFKPFKGTFEVYVDVVLQIPPPPPKIQEVLGTGNATHLGNTNVYIKQWWMPPTPPIIPPYTGTGWGEMVFTAANGDLLLAYYDDATAVHHSPSFVYVTLTGIFKDGGTGKFANAEGSFIWVVEFNPELNEGSVEANGEIKYNK